jgi:hypothetical protein
MTDTTALDELLPERPYLILDPVAHRMADPLRLCQLRPTDWICDVCSTPLDYTRPIPAWGTTKPSYALCADCLPAELVAILELEPTASVFTPCRCAGCEPAYDAAITARLDAV